MLQQILQEKIPSCLVKKVAENYRELIKDFEEKWMEIYMEHKVFFTNKCHVIIEHIPQVIERTGKGLFFSSEQVVEASHQKFGIYWVWGH